ncbi:MAG TPA: zf-HC2 domain-containing protein [Patescibacteria group bacterium]|nr:zf-HC2 domain-containing protein [Patescibacteria group bacterium]
MSEMDERGHPVDDLSALLDGELETGERDRVESHLAGCSGCRALLEDLRRLDAAVGAEAIPPVPPGLERRIRAGLGARTGGAPEAERSGRATVWRSWRASMPLAAAASLIVAAAIWLLRPVPSEVPRPETPQEQASRPEMSPPEPPVARGDERKKDAGASARAQSDAISRESAPPATRPVPPAAEAAPGQNVASVDKQEPARKSARALESEAPRRLEAAADAAPAPVAPSDTRDRPAMAQVEPLSQSATDSISPRAAAGRVGWPVRIEAPPYDVLLTAEDAMVVSAGSWICRVAIDAADGRRLAALARSAPPGGTVAQLGAAQPSAPQPGATPPRAAQPPPPRPSAADAALSAIRERYRAQIEARCGPLPR